MKTFSYVEKENFFYHFFYEIFFNETKKLSIFLFKPKNCFLSKENSLKVTTQLRNALKVHEFSRFENVLFEYKMK
jgi:hypothetical protein